MQVFILQGKTGRKAWKIILCFLFKPLQRDNVWQIDVFSIHILDMFILHLWVTQGIESKAVLNPVAWDRTHGQEHMSVRTHHTLTHTTNTFPNATCIIIKILHTFWGIARTNIFSTQISPWSLEGNHVLQGWLHSIQEETEKQNKKRTPLERN